MSMLVAALIFIPLLAVAIAHFIWSIGGTWPLKSRELLIKTVYGRPGTKSMPPKLITFVVAVLILTAGVIALSLADETGGGLPLTLAGTALAALFLARGVVGYTPRWRKIFTEEPFATLDRKNYSPLCLLIGVGFVILVVLRLL
jgi:hypothetical protein